LLATRSAALESSELPSLLMPRPASGQIQFHGVRKYSKEIRVKLDHHRDVLFLI
jgi:hypothetical protein